MTNSINSLAAAASGSDSAREAFIHQQEQMILNTASRASYCYVTKSDDEWSVALSAFSEAIDKYDLSRGDFIPFSQILIKRALIDYHRREAPFLTEISTSPFVLEAYKRYDTGSTMKEIRDWLNAEGVTNTLGKPVTYNSVERMLKNRRYIGEYVYKDVVIPDGIPAIVPQDLFDRVQQKLEQNKRAPARHKAEDDYLLTTKLFCGYCGALLFGECGTGRSGVTHHYYKCASVKRKSKECSCRAFRKQWLEDLVVTEAMDMLSDDRVIDAIVSMVMVLQDQENTSLPLLERQLQEADSAIENMLNAIQQGILTRSTKTRLEELEASRDNLEAQIALEKMAKPRITEEQVRYFLKRFRKFDMAKLEHRKILVGIFLNAVYIYNDHMDIAFNYKEGTKTINFSDMECALSQRASVPGSDLELSPVPY